MSITIYTKNDELKEKEYEGNIEYCNDLKICEIILEKDST